jgi:hypothetical protein
MATRALKTVEQVLDEMDELESWRPALIAFYERDEMPTKARLLRDGAPLDYLDHRAIDALKAAIETKEDS